MEVAPGAGRVGDGQPDLFARIDDEQRTHGQGVVGIRMDQVVEVRHLAVGIRQDREVDQGVLGFVDVFNPSVVRVHRVDRQRNGLDPTPGEVFLEPGGKPQLRGAHRGEVRRMGKQHAPAVAQPLVETNGTGAGILFEIGGDVAQSEAHGAAPGQCVMNLLCPVFQHIKKNK
ncbi:hypothetical protein D3C84_302550 [compost metagenome]